MESERQHLVNTESNILRAEFHSHINGCVLKTQSDFALNVHKERKYVWKYSETANSTPNNSKFNVFQYMLTKTCDHLGNIPPSIMSTYWKQKKWILLCTTCIIVLLGLITFLNLPIGKSRTSSSFQYQYENFESNIVNKTSNISDWSNRDNIESQSITSDYVKITKVHNFSLNSDDLLYESKRNGNKKDYFPAYSVTGNFRSKSNQIWDPHPEYILTVFGHQLHLILHQDNSFITPNTFRVRNL